MKAYRFLCGCKNHANIFSRSIYVSHIQYGIYRYPTLVSNRILSDPKKNTISLEEKIFNSLKGKLVYNSLASRTNERMRWKIRAAELNQQKKEENPYVTPVSLKYMFEDCDIAKCADEKGIENESDDDIIETDDEMEESFNLPYSKTQKVEIESDYDEDEELMMRKELMFAYQDGVDRAGSNDSVHSTPDEKNAFSEFAPNKIERIERKLLLGVLGAYSEQRKEQSYSLHDISPKPINGRQWMSDYECFDETIDENSQFSPSEIDYGTPDPTIPASIIPCGGCGAHLHCKDSAIPGYLPKELFTKCSKKDLMSLLCQRCTFLKNYNTALTVNVDPKSYPALLSKIKNRTALVILMVDMTDFPCSIWPDLWSVIGQDKPLIVVGNKIDLIPGDSPGWLSNAEKSLRSHFPQNANILHIGFTSAKSKFGIEELITKLYNVWGSKGDVYIVGCTNVGKSSLFNVLIASDYCRSQAADLIQRAVTSPWPGTTLNLLKFPITKLTGYKAFLRTSRLVSRRIQASQERKLATIQAKMDNMKISKLPNIIGTVEQTFKKPPDEFTTHNLSDDRLFDMPLLGVKQLKKNNKIVFNPDDKKYNQSFWCFDTPGVVHQDHIIDLLTTDEIIKVLPQSTIVPQIYSVRSEQTLFIGGVARIDVLNCDWKFLRIIVYASKMLPISLCETKFAEDVYETLLGTSYMAVPIGSVARLEKWPELKHSEDFVIEGKGNALVSSEIVLSSAGWIGSSLPLNKTATIRPWTPLARGIRLRNVPVLPYMAKLRKKRIANTPTYYLGSI